MLEKRRADKNQALNDTLLLQLEQERKTQETLASDTQVLRASLNAKDLLIQNYEETLRDQARQQYMQEQDALRKELLEAQDALKAQRELQKTLNDEHEKEKAAAAAKLEQAT